MLPPPQYAHVCARVAHVLFPSPRMCTREGGRKLQTLGGRHGVLFDPPVTSPFEAKNWDRELIRELSLASGVSPDPALLSSGSK